MEMRFVYNSETPCFYRVKTLRRFERIIRAILERHEKPYRLFISYKNRHRVKKVAGRIFMWDETEETRNGIDVASGEQGFGKPRFDGVWAALFITDECIVAFGDARLIAEEEIGEVRKRFYAVCICADDWWSNSKCVGKYSGESLHEGGWRNERTGSAKLT